MRGRASGWDEETPSLESDTYSEPLAMALKRIKQRQKRALLESVLSQSVPGHTYSLTLAFICLSLASDGFLPLSSQPSCINLSSQLF